MLEYVVFDNAQIIHCYVIHLDLSRDAARCIMSLLLTAYISNSERKSGKKGTLLRILDLYVLESGDRKRQKEASLAKAQQ